MEPAFNNTQMTNNGFQDPMGHDAHQGLERYLDKFHQPGIPSHTIITDPEYTVYLWFHNAQGEVIHCPYIDEFGLKPRLPSVDFPSVNNEFSSSYALNKNGVFGGGEEATIPTKAVDLTPFVREATLPEISPAGGEKIVTLFGETTAGSFSPYASDGSKEISLQVVDTEYSILDAIFYPWMKDINSPWWYRSDAVFSEWATPYPMATLEITRPRMRYIDSYGENHESRDEETYKYYSYKFIGVKPTSYDPFEINAGGRSNLLRNISFICDMCLVDLTNDTHMATDGWNGGNRKGFIFGQDQSVSEQDEVDDDQSDEEEDSDLQDALDEEFNLDSLFEDNEEMVDDMDDWDEDDEWPGDEEDEMTDDELDDLFGDDDEQDSEMDDDFDDLFDDSDGSDDDSMYDGFDDEDPGANDYNDDGALDYEAMSLAANENNAGIETPIQQEESGFFSSVMDTLCDVGSGVMDAASSAAGWVADGVSAGVGLAADVASNAVGAAVDIASTTVNAAAGVTTTAIGAAANLASTAISATSGLAGSVTNAVGSVIGSATGALSALGGGTTTPQQSGQTSTSDGGGIFSTIGSALSGVMGIGSTAMGVVSNVAQSAISGATSTATSATTLLGGVLNKSLGTASSLLGGTVAQAGNILGGTISSFTNMVTGGSSRDTNVSVQAIGTIKQQIAVTNQVRQNQTIVNQLNNSASSIQSRLGEISPFISSLVSDNQSGTSSELAKLASRIISSGNIKPTPIESYVTMIIKQNARGSSRI